ncbi:GCN5-related N-acetyltransferase [Gluconacetobacter diazotrophicus PA1 5]|uniref:GNAT family N-acetyltransferase n=1 Tax=Gluconacetobacter diazotrophicus TaxID=33996 RepID=A0A7W4I6S2_GLUDI|nr:GNAT family N-acetyltransferase [Gluconacetobacter diazotrophicus]ACI49997.1 GCN5-related N-acetyltransferase [Gluconacetobacter diazotrophicus PA1 5]MBB2157323.1 GNAT family N-acetyltransferase [Gluconacetobacter diazotrophicus]TWB00694.1 L-amino acid N-acyltransferase YncA [Gluconacetobacter diazotrophicus]
MEAALYIRRAKPDDCALIFAIHKDSVLGLCASHYSDTQMSAWFEGRASDDYTTAVELGSCWIAYKADDPVGFLGLFANRISMIFVQSAASGQGIGTILLHFALDRIREAGNSSAILDATLNAQGFYEKYGFRKVADSHLVRPSGMKIETVVMERSIRSPPRGRNRDRTVADGRAMS